MKLISFREGGRTRAGVVVGAPGAERVVDLSSSARELIEAGWLNVAAGIAASHTADFALADVALDLPIPDAGKIFCVGVNYQDRNAEYKDGSEAPKFPSLFMRTSRSFVPHGAPVLIPRESEQLDYEGEIVLVIGKAGRRIAAGDAMQHVAGLTLMNEGSVRDWIRHGKFNVTQGKNFESSGSIGPWIETDLSSIDPLNLRLETRINGELRQGDTTASMAFSLPRIIEYISTFTTLDPGDLIATGTPTGSGARFDPPRWLKPGDVVEVSVAGIGTLRNGVAAEGKP